LALQAESFKSTGLQDRKDLPVHPARLARREYPAKMEPMLLEAPALEEITDSPVHLGNPGPKGLPDLLGLLASQAPATIVRSRALPQATEGGKAGDGGGEAVDDDGADGTADNSGTLVENSGGGTFDEKGTDPSPISAKEDNWRRE